MAHHANPQRKDKGRKSEPLHQDQNLSVNPSKFAKYKHHLWEDFARQNEVEDAELELGLRQS